MTYSEIKEIEKKHLKFESLACDRWRYKIEMLNEEISEAKEKIQKLESKRDDFEEYLQEDLKLDKENYIAIDSLIRELKHQKAVEKASEEAAKGKIPLSAPKVGKTA